MKILDRKYFSVLLPSLLLLQSCGGGGSPSTENPLMVSGTAATGLPMSDADIVFKCQKSVVSTKADAKGIYGKTIAPSELPCLVRASVSGLQLHSIAASATSDITVNITPKTELVASHLLSENPSDAFNADRLPSAITASSTKIIESIGIVRQATSSLVNTDGYDPISVKFSIGDAYDQKLDSLQAALTQKNISFNSLRQAFIFPLEKNISRIDYVSGVLAGSTGSTSGGQPDAISQDFLTQSAQWISGSYTDNTGTSQFKAEFYLSRLLNMSLEINQYSLSTQNSYEIVNYQSCSSASKKFLTKNGTWEQPNCSKPILTGAQIISGVNDSEFFVVLKSDGGSLSAGKWKITAFAEDVSGSEITNKFNTVYVNNKIGKFTNGSKIYTAYLTAIDPEYFIARDPIPESAKDSTEFTAKYNQQNFCGINMSRYANGSLYGNAKYGIRFSSNDQKAQLVPVDQNCNTVPDAYPLINLDWQITSVNNQEVIEFTGAKLPAYTDLSFGQVSGGYDSNEINPGLRYWTDKYKLIIIRNPDGTIQTGIKILPNASVHISPGNGPYLNRAALNSMLQLVGYPAFSQ